MRETCPGFLRRVPGRDSNPRPLDRKSDTLPIAPRIPRTKLMSTEQVHTLAHTDKQLISHVKSRKLRHFGHVMRQPQDSIEKSMMTGLVEGCRSHGRPRICWFENIKAWTGLSGSTLMHATRDTRALEFLYSSMQSIVTGRRRRSDIT